MKKLVLLFLFCFIVLQSQITHAQINVKETHFWDTFYSANSCVTNEYVNSGYYMFCPNIYDVVRDLPQEFNIVNIEDDMYLPISANGEIKDRLALLYVDEDILYTDVIEKFINNMLEISYYSDYLINGFPIYYYSSEYPYNGPHFNSSVYYTQYLSAPASLSLITQSIYCVDPYDNFIYPNELVILRDDYSVNINIPGIYEVILYAENSLGNHSTHSIFIEIINDTYPTITSNNNIIVSSGYLLTDDILLNHVNAFDYKYSPLEVNIEFNNYSHYYKIKGTYEVSFITTDSYSQSVTSSSYINVVESTISFYSIDYSNIYIEEVIDITDDELINILKLVSNKEFTYCNVDSLIKQEKGSYYVFYEILDEDNNIISEEKLNFIFLNDTQDEVIDIDESSFNFNYIIIPSIAISIICVVAFFVYNEYKKRKI